MLALGVISWIGLGVAAAIVVLYIGLRLKQQYL